MNEFANGLPWRRILIKEQHQSLEKRPSHASPFAVAATEQASASAPRDTCARPSLRVTNSEPVLSSADFNFQAAETVSERSPLVPKLFLGLIAALFLAVLIPWLLNSQSSELRTSAAYRTGGPVAFSGPARAGAKIQEEDSPNSRSVAHGSASASRPDLSRSERLNTALDRQPDTFVEPERTSGILNSNQWRPPKPRPDSGTRTAALESLSRQLQKIDIQQRECELVLKLLRSESGIFDGFVPDENLTGVSYLARFQDKIIQLEINKRSLEVRFTPGSREIRAIDLEIRGVRAAMRECLEANLRFLKKDKEALLAQKAGLEGRKGPVSGGGKSTGAQISDQSSTGRSWFSISGGIDALERGLSRGLAYLSPAIDIVRPPKLSRDRDWSQMAASGQKNPHQQKDRTPEKNRTATSSPATRDSRASYLTVRRPAGDEAEGLNKNQSAIRSKPYESSRVVRHGRQ